MSNIVSFPHSIPTSVDSISQEFMAAGSIELDARNMELLRKMLDKLHMEIQQLKRELVDGAASAGKSEAGPCQGTASPFISPG